MKKLTRILFCFVLLLALSLAAAAEGSTEITMKPEYLENLENGIHTIEIVSTDGSAATDFTILAKAPVYYTVSFVMNGHGQAIPAQTVLEGTRAQQPQVQSDAKWTFVGWYKDAGCTTVFNFNEPITKDTTVYAKFIPKTGDNSSLWIALLAFGGVGMAVLTVNGKKKKQH